MLQIEPIEYGKDPDSTIMGYGRSYFKAAKKLEESLEKDGDYIFPIFMLSAFSIELYFKGLYTEVKEYYKNESGNIGCKTYSEYSSDEFKNNLQVKGHIDHKKIVTLNKGNHDLLKLFQKLEEVKPDVYENLIQQYQNHTKKDLLADLKKCKDAFKDDRYPYENMLKQVSEGVSNNQKIVRVRKNFNDIYYLAEFLYEFANPYKNKVDV